MTVDTVAVGTITIVAMVVVMLLIACAFLDRIAILRREIESEKADNAQLRGLLRSRGVSPPPRGTWIE